MARFVAHDALRGPLLGVPHERAALGAAVTQLASVTWDEAEEPGSGWLSGCHVSSQAPALAAVLLGDVESEDGAQGGGVALSPSSVGALVLGMARALTRPSNSGSHLWPVSRARALRRTRAAGRRVWHTAPHTRRTAARGADDCPPLMTAQASAVRAVARGRGG